MRRTEWTGKLVGSVGVAAAVLSGHAGAQVTVPGNAGAIAPVSAQATAPATTPVYVPADQIQDPTNTLGRRVHTIATLSPADRGVLQRAIQQMPRFPAYVYSGCDDRAQAAYMLLPNALQQKAAKIWVFAPSQYTPALKGSIGLRNAGAAPVAVPASAPAAAPVTWRYHVALAFGGGGDSVLVYDAVLAPDRVMTRDAWFSLMTFPPLSFWTLLPGSGYSFNGVTVFDAVIPSGRSPNLQPFNGFVFEHTWESGNRLAENLARDAVGAGILKGTVCPALRDSVAKPLYLLKVLTGKTAPAPCLTLYEQERKQWEALLPAKPKPPQSSTLPSALSGVALAGRR